MSNALALYWLSINSLCVALLSLTNHTISPRLRWAVSSELCPALQWKILQAAREILQGLERETWTSKSDMVNWTKNQIEHSKT